MFLPDDVACSPVVTSVLGGADQKIWQEVLGRVLLPNEEYEEVVASESLVAREGFISLTSSSCLPRLLCSMVWSLVKRETGGRTTRIGAYNAARGWQLHDGMPKMHGHRAPQTTPRASAGAVPMVKWKWRGASRAPSKPGNDAAVKRVTGGAQEQLNHNQLTG